jgi:fatty-acyl-CoA synthase
VSIDTAWTMNVHNADARLGAGARASDADLNPSAVKAWLRALELTKPIAEQPARLLPDIIDDLAEKFGEAPALLSDRETLSFGALSTQANRYARWALNQGLGKGDVVGLLMPNRPEYMAIWLGITHVGGIVALLNTNLVGSSLAHCINIVAPKHIIVAAELLAAFDSARAQIELGAKLWSHGTARNLPDIEHTVAGCSGERLANLAHPAATIADCALYIYTSGTTGLPKAAKVSHQRLLTWSYWFAGMMDTGPGDRLYNCLPMHHSIGGVVATGAVLLNGGSVVIRERFSARHFWDDVVRFDCTLFQYIGELCRYLVRSKPHPREREHRLRLCCGNGLRADVWNEFKTRFRIPRILEFYAATEGNVTMFNVEGKPGAIGRIPSFLAHRSAIALVKFDVDAGKPVRDSQGFCVRCNPDEAGEAIGRILDATAGPGGRFEGYTNAADSNRKVLRDVFEAGDIWYRTGDLMRRDTSGYFYFVDRIGDTFRWKGENVSTAEVAETIAGFPGVIDASVYGVTLPGADGRAGMAAIVSETTLDLAALRAHLAAHLPDYAHPMFLRLCRAIETTSTFKHRKSDLVRDGFDPSATSDMMYFNDTGRQAFVPLDRTIFERIASGQILL